MATLATTREIDIQTVLVKGELDNSLTSTQPIKFTGTLWAFKTSPSEDIRKRWELNGETRDRYGKAEIIVVFLNTKGNCCYSEATGMMWQKTYKPNKRKVKGLKHPIAFAFTKVGGGESESTWEGHFLSHPDDPLTTDSARCTLTLL